MCGKECRKESAHTYMQSGLDNDRSVSSWKCKHSFQEKNKTSPENRDVFIRIKDICKLLKVAMINMIL